MLLRLWLIFSQAATIAVAVLFVVSTFRPEWLPARGMQMIPQSAPAGTSSAARPSSFSDAVQRASPSVVNISTSKQVRSPRHPLLNDPVFRGFFGEQFSDEPRRASSLGSGVIVSSAG